jgi:hypothetical protein
MDPVIHFTLMVSLIAIIVLNHPDQLFLKEAHCFEYQVGELCDKEIKDQEERNEMTIIMFLSHSFCFVLHLIYERGRTNTNSQDVVG